MTYAFPYFVRCLSQFIPQCKLGESAARLLVYNAAVTNHFKNLDHPIRLISTSHVKRQENEDPEEEQIDPRVLRNPERDRRTKISVETSIRYLKSSAFKEAYGDQPVWFYYRRNFKGHWAPLKTRKMCIRNNVVTTGSPCPICRDEYLVVDHTNIELLKHFISPVTGGIISYQKTGVCQLQHKKLLIAYTRARDLGLITFDLPFRKYDYSEYKPQ